MPVKTWLQQIVNRFVQPERPAQRLIYVPLRSAGVRVDHDTALKISAVWAAVRVIAENIAGLPWRAYRRLPNGDHEVQSQHPVTSVLHRWPNAEMTPFTFRETLLGWALTWGNGYAEIERDAAGRVTGLWPIAPDRVEVRREPDGELLYLVTQYSGNGRRQVDVPAKDMFHLHGLGFDGLTGYSVVSYAAKSMGISLAAEEFGAAFFGNGSTVHGVLQHPGKLKEEAKQMISESWAAMHQGAASAWKTAVLEEGMTWHNIGLPPGDSQFLETRQFQVNDIARWFRVPPHKLGDLTKTSYASQEHASIEFVTEALVPWCIRLEQEADRKLFGLSSSSNLYTKIGVNALLRGDMAARSSFYKEMYYLGVLSINEIRQLEDMNSIGEDGDARFVQANMMPLHRALEEPEEPEEPEELEEPEPEEEPEEPEEPEEQPMTPPRAVRAGLDIEHYR